MNFLAHCFLAQPTPFSLYGNLLGDFIGGASLDKLPSEVLKGLENHKLVDKFTDSHASLQPLKQLMSKDRRRFTGIISDVVFDYFLIKHWRQFNQQELHFFVNDVYDKIQQVLPMMHPRMQRSMQFMLTENGLMVNQDLIGVGKTLDRLSNRIRFENKLRGGIEEIEQHYDSFESAFLWLLPELINAVESAKIEKN